MRRILSTACRSATSISLILVVLTIAALALRWAQLASAMVAGSGA